MPMATRPRIAKSVFFHHERFACSWRTVSCFSYSKPLEAFIMPSRKSGGIYLEPISKFAFEPRDVIFMAKREVEGEEYRDMLSPNRSVTAKNRVLCEPEWNFEIDSSDIQKAPPIRFFENRIGGGSNVLRNRRKNRNVPHLASGTTLTFPVEMKLRLRIAKKVLPLVRLIAKEITHHPCRMRGWISKGEVTHRPDMLFKLACDTRIYRPVPRVVRTRCEFIGKHLSILRHEHFHSEKPHDIQLVCDEKRDVYCLLLYPLVYACRWPSCLGEDAVLVRVLDDGIKLHVSVKIPRDDNRYLTSEIYLRFKNARDASEREKCLVEYTDTGNNPLTPAVVSHSPCFQDGGERRAPRKNFWKRRAIIECVVGIVYPHGACEGNLKIQKQFLFFKTVLHNAEHLCPRAHGNHFRNLLHERDGDIFKLKRCHVRKACEHVECVRVFVRRLDWICRHIHRRRVSWRRPDNRAVP